MKNFVERFGPWSLVTGASSGIGGVLARRLAEIGMNLVLVARREERLRHLAEDLQSRHSVSTRVVPVDLSQDDFLPIVEEATADLEVGLLVNNAGIATIGKFLDNDLRAELAVACQQPCLVDPGPSLWPIDAETSAGRDDLRLFNRRFRRRSLVEQLRCVESL